MTDLEQFLNECEIDVCSTRCEIAKKLLAMVRWYGATKLKAILKWRPQMIKRLLCWLFVCWMFGHKLWTDYGYKKTHCYRCGRWVCLLLILLLTSTAYADFKVGDSCFKWIVKNWCKGANFKTFAEMSNPTTGWCVDVNSVEHCNRPILTIADANLMAEAWVNGQGE